MPSTDDYTYSDTARALALPIDDDDSNDGLSRTTSNPRRSTEPIWQRRSASRSQEQLQPRWRRGAEQFQQKATRVWFSFTPLQRAGLIILNVVLILSIVLGLIYNERIFAKLVPVAKRWREMPAGWLILWLLTFAVSFPPMIGYSTCVTIAGFVFGMKGWFIMSTATVVGSTCSFIVSRTVLQGFVSRLTEKNAQFTALSLVLKRDGLKLLIMIRICPLPYSLSNGAISTIPTVTWQNFALATAIASPKLLLHIFVGSRLGDLAENGDKMEWGTKIVSYVSILIGMIAGAGTGYWVYARTKARAAELEAEEPAAGGSASAGDRRRGSSGANEYADEPDARSSSNVARKGADDVSLHTTYEDDLEGGRGTSYRDDFTDDEDAQERDVFGDGDGDEDDDPWSTSVRR